MSSNIDFVEMDIDDDLLYDISDIQSSELSRFEHDYSLDLNTHSDINNSNIEYLDESLMDLDFSVIDDVEDDNITNSLFSNNNDLILSVDESQLLLDVVATPPNTPPTKKVIKPAKLESKTKAIKITENENDDKKISFHDAINDVVNNVYDQIQSIKSEETKPDLVKNNNNSENIIIDANKKIIYGQNFSNNDLKENEGKRVKRKKQIFIINQEFINRISNIATIIFNNDYYQSIYTEFNDILNELNFQTVNFESYIFNTLISLIPNNISIEYFLKFNIIDKWQYEEYRGAYKFAVRWTKQRMNFYEPMVIRYNSNIGNEDPNKQGLCPYCPFDITKDNWNDNFYTINDSAYMHHVCKNHGVYSTGRELIPPLIGLINNKFATFCTKCKKISEISKIGHGFDNGLISFFRHTYECHNETKQNRTIEQIKNDKDFFNVDPKTLKFEIDDNKLLPKSKYYPLIYFENGLQLCNNQELYNLFNKYQTEQIVKKLQKKGEVLERKKLKLLQKIDESINA